MFSDARQVLVDLTLHRDPPADLVDHSPARYLYFLWQYVNSAWSSRIIATAPRRAGY